MYLSAFPHRTFERIDKLSIRIIRPDALIDDGGDDENGENNGEWDHINTENIFSSFELYDDVMAWYDDAFYLAVINEIDFNNESFTVTFYEDQMEVDSYKACWLNHLE